MLGVAPRGGGEGRGMCEGREGIDASPWLRHETRGRKGRKAARDRMGHPLPRACS